MIDSRLIDDHPGYNYIYLEEEESHDELEAYLGSPIEPACKDPLLWWQANESRYPVLSRMAFDLLSCPCMSAECERCFSKAGHVLNRYRPRTLAELGEANQCLKAWITAGLVTLTEESVVEAGITPENH